MQNINLGRKQLEQLGGFLVLALAALFFESIYGAVQGAFWQNAWVLERAIKIIAVVGFAWVAVEIMSHLPSRLGATIVSTAIFGTLYWWSQPIVAWLAVGVVEGQGGVFDTYTWSQRFNSFSRADFWALLSTSLAMVGVENFRRGLFRPQPAQTA